MNNFHGACKRSSFFEGWYFKHQDEKNMLAVIPSFHIDKRGKKMAMIQLITNENTYFSEYSAEEFAVSANRLYIRIGNSYFCEQGIKLDMVAEGINIQGKIKYGEFTPIRYNIMGPFMFVPFMQCFHGVISLDHGIQGSVQIHDKRIAFKKGVGYIEKDWGRSFPKSYFWTQCNYFSRSRCCVMLSIASIPFLKREFSGCIGIVYYEGREYRFATYYGVKIVKCTREEVKVQQGKLSLSIQILQKNELPLKAPQNGKMVRTIKESPSCQVRYHFLKENKTIFDMVSNKASFEGNFISADETVDKILASEGL